MSTSPSAPASAAHGRSGRSRYALVVLAAAVSLAAGLASAVLSLAAAGVVAVLMVLVIAWGWPAASGAAELRGRKRILAHSGIIAVAGLASCALVTWPGTQELLPRLPAVVALGVVACFIAELMRGEGAPGRLESVISGCVGVLAAVSAAGWIGVAVLYAQHHATWVVWGTGAVVAACIAVVGTRMIMAGPRGGPRRGALTLGITPVAFLGIMGYAGSMVLLALQRVLA